MKEGFKIVALSCVNGLVMLTEEIKFETVIEPDIATTFEMFTAVVGFVTVTLPETAAVLRMFTAVTGATLNTLRALSDLLIAAKFPERSPMVTLWFVD